MAAEDKKPNSERLREFGEAGRSSLEMQLYSDAPIYTDLETAKLADSLGMLMEQLGADHEITKKVLAGKSPRERAADLIKGCTLIDVEARKKLAKGGQGAIESSKDSMIQLARSIDPRARELRKVLEQQVEEPQRQAYAKVAAARFATLGSSTYPDATFTLRLAYGTVKGYEDEGKQIPPWTTMGGTFKHAEAHGSKEPFELPESWLKNKSKIKADTPFNFVSTADIIGGNSGSPVVDRNGDLVGLIFDGNIESLVGAYVYDDATNRAVSVHAAAMLEALRKLYDATALANELQGISAAAATGSTPAAATAGK
jgi:hypothetical protein